jgi:glycine hydroxymethyltransferase
MKAQSLVAYLASKDPAKIDPAFLAYASSLWVVAETAPAIARSIVSELLDQRSNLKLIASENYSSMAVQLAMGNLLTDKYAEGFPYHRFYAGCDNVDAVESFACEAACRLFGADHAYVQPHSGADANLVAYWAILSKRVRAPFLDAIGQQNILALDREQWHRLRNAMGNQRLLSLDYFSGGHLTHGYRHNVSAQMFDVHSYGVSRASGLIDYEEIDAMAQEIKPLILLAGYSAYPRKINFRRMREIADAAGAVLMVDMAHFAGLVAGGVFTGDFNPIPFAQVVTTTTHKTLRGPRGGMILCTSEFAESVDKGCPLILGGPLPHCMAAKAVCFVEALTDDFRRYAHNVAENAAALTGSCISEGMTVVSGGTDNHLVLIDVRPFGISGRQAESALRECGVTLNRNAIPYDPNGAWYTSGLRIGTPAVTTLGMGLPEMKEIASIIRFVLSHVEPVDADIEGKREKSKTKYSFINDIQPRAKERVDALLSRFRLYPELEEQLLREIAGL